MSRPLRHHPPDAVLEITTRTIQGRFLLRPSRKLTAIILGILGRALSRYGVRLHGFFFASNHYHLIISIEDVRQLSRFMAYVNGNLAREAGRLHGWEGSFWGRRYASIDILDEEAQVERLGYVLANGCKEGLVADPREWPGATSVHSLLDGTPLVGTWYDRSAQWYARRSGGTADEEQFAEKVEFELSPLPCWAHLDEAERQARVTQMVEDIAAETRERHRAEGTRPLGVHQLLVQDPQARPESHKKSPAPRCHTSSRERWFGFIAAYRQFEDAYREASARWLDGLTDTIFPPDCFPPPLTFARIREPALVPS